MKLQSLEKTLKEKKLSQDKMYNLNGGYTRTGCDRALVSDGTEWICKDSDNDTSLEPMGSL